MLAVIVKKRDLALTQWHSVICHRLLDSSMLNAEVKEGEILPPTIQRLMKGYNKYLRPFFDNGPVTVGMSLDIASIDTISEINMDYTATIFLRQRWTDERLVFEGNKSLSLDGRLVELLWVPDTFIVDSKKSFLHDITVENRLIRIFPNGTVLYALRWYNKQGWGYNINDVMFYWTRGNESVSGLDTLQLAQYTVEDHYTSVSEAIYETGRYPRLVFHFELKRSILYFILETYVPSSLLVVLSWVSFWISLSSVPARICIGVTTVLTMTTLMMGARTSLPNANCFIKAIDVYLGICFSFIFGALIEYAVAHFCTLTHTDSHMLMLSSPSLSSSSSPCQHVQSTYGHHMHDFDDEINGIITTICSHSNRVKRRKEPAATSAPAPSSTELTSAPRVELEKIAKVGFYGKPLWSNQKQWLSRSDSSGLGLGVTVFAKVLLPSC
ncbi:Gamma-aminobutyric acid receptor subunit pi GABA(A) receptor subunit pi Precursor [Channa argus]|uniref:Gamma-aminobutyric acid receptor subunit pi GABA(A) receptor subunit pi n=1 Tax=Channa argus TaxID=215402 RepID=A0A6G1R1T8_CHAAH|nr:Gamma-aminobutyric acid receptor subunit pi GABA(A) receptor subunit pi Precursor [Channa argus]